MSAEVDSGYAIEARGLGKMLYVVCESGGSFETDAVGALA
jgi:hypothetical protein